MIYDPDLSDVPIGPPDLQAARAPSVPGIGEHVLYRHDEHGDITDALIVGIDLDEHTTPTGAPWPLVTLTTGYGRVQTREALVRASPGWLPADWMDHA